MKKDIYIGMILAALMLTLCACGGVPEAENSSPAAAEVQSEDDGQIIVSETVEEESGREDGERFEATIILEGMEETVRYEHIRNEALGFEMDYDYGNFVRRSDGERECFISDWDDPENPENYLEVSYDTSSAELTANAINMILSESYDTLYDDAYELDGAGKCIRIEASVVKGTNNMADRLQTVYIIPAGDGCRVARAYCAIEGAEGYGRRFAYMVKTLTVIDRPVEGQFSDEQALSAIRSYCYAQNPDLEQIVNAGEYPVYWEIGEILGEEFGIGLDPLEAVGDCP